MLSSRLIYLTVFIEGFCSLGAEVIALRRLVPHIGSAIVVTAPTIGFFLLALALGYAAGAKVKDHFRETVARNFLWAGTLTGLGLSGVFVDALFEHLPPAWFAYLCFVGGILAPIAWLLGQTVPILTNSLAKHQRAGEASGNALYWSTLGSFLGSLGLSLGVMQWLGVPAAILLCAMTLMAGSLCLHGQRYKIATFVLLTVGLSFWLSNQHAIQADTAYAEYQIRPVTLTGQGNMTAFMVNRSTASLIDPTGPKVRYTRYIEHLRKVLLEDFAFRDKEILVLGAGGFTLSHQEQHNHYTYVDIDPAIRQLAETSFLKAPIQGEFVVDDARQFLLRTEQRYAAVVVDVYSAHTSIPSHLVTQEFWASTRRVLNKDGLMLANLILDSKLETPYARHLLATIESVYGRCAVDVLHRQKPLSNVEVLCHASSFPDQQVNPYRDELNRADLDLAQSR